MATVQNCQTFDSTTVVLELSDVGLMNKSTRHKAGTKVEQGICYVFDQTNKGFTFNGLVHMRLEAVR